jgi:hypothetical protein
MPDCFYDFPKISGTVRGWNQLCANHACEEDESAIFFAYDAKWKCSKMVMECKLL